MTGLQSASTTWEVHRGHVALLGVWLLVVGVVLARGRLADRRSRRSRRGGRASLPRTGWLWAAGAASVLSAGVHLAVTREHFEESILYGVFFLLLTWLQVAWALWLVRRPSTTLLVAGALASTAVVMLWLATRTIGVPVGPGAGTTEPFGLLDLLASGAEVAVAAFAVLALRTVTPPPRRVLEHGTGARLSRP